MGGTGVGRQAEGREEVSISLRWLLESVGGSCWEQSSVALETLRCSTCCQAVYLREQSNEMVML